MTAEPTPQIRQILHEAARGLGGVVLVTAPADLGGRCGRQLADQIRALIKQGDVRIVVDMKKAKRLPGSAVGELLRCTTEARMAGGGLCLARLRAAQYHALALVGADRWFIKCRTLEDAVASFSAAEEPS